MSRMLVLDQQRRPLMPCTPARARLLLKQHKAAVWRRYPFTLILRVARPDAITQPLRLKIDPGSRTSGLAVTNDATGEVVWAAELSHRGEQEFGFPHLQAQAGLPLRDAAAVNSIRWLRFVCSKTVKTGAEQQRDECPVDN